MDPEFIVILFLGLCLGSFATALIWRIPRGEGWLAVRSRCTSCGKNLGILSLIPLFSWLTSKGKCRYCGEKISWIYPVTELCVAAACLLIFNAWGVNVVSFLMMISVPFLAALLVIDIRQMILPNQLMLAFVITGIAHGLYSAYQGRDIEIALVFLLGAALFFFVAWIMEMATTRILGRESLGMGDIKFFAAAGLWLGPSGLALFMVLAGMLGIILGVWWRIQTKKDLFPFGPALILSFFTVLLLKGYDISIPYLYF